MNRRTYRRVKRVADVAAAGLGLIATAPVQAAIAVAVACDVGRPVLFRQVRPGQSGQLFTLVKFRTMRAPIPHPEHDVATATGDVATDSARLTRFGAFLRASSLDELPTLWNVLVGDMSIVGPRPLLPEYLELYSDRQRRRHEVRPGITGLAQVSGRNALAWDDRFELDVDYVERQSVALDMSILMKTLIAVLRRDGINAEGHTTMSPFRGSAENA